MAYDSHIKIIKQIIFRRIYKLPSWNVCTKSHTREISWTRMFWKFMNVTYICETIEGSFIHEFWKYSYVHYKYFILRRNWCSARCLEISGTKGLFLCPCMAHTIIDFKTSVCTVDGHVQIVDSATFHILETKRKHFLKLNSEPSSFGSSKILNTHSFIVLKPFGDIIVGNCWGKVFFLSSTVLQ